MDIEFIKSKPFDTGCQMAFDDLQAFIDLLEARGQLTRIASPVSPILEMAAIAEQVFKGPVATNKALLFENPTDSAFPTLMNAFGSAERTAWALGVSDLNELAERLGALIDPHLPQGTTATARRGWSLLSALRAAGLRPRTVRSAICQQVIETAHPSLADIPILQCWPEDGGRFITLPQVVTRNPATGTRNVGMYRLQVADNQTLIMHWQRHKGGAEHERRALERTETRIPAAIVLGGDPASIYCASAPLPPDIDEYLLAGWLRGQPLEFVKCVSQPLQVPANADFVIEGYVDLTDYRDEGPFGDHTGYYTPVERFPAFKVTAMTHQRNAVYPATVVGIPPMEDYWLGKATERLFLPLIQMILPEVVDIHMPAEGVFHNLVLVRIRKRFPGHARKVMHGLFGMALMSLAKAVVVVDEWVDVQDLSQVAWQVLGNVDWMRDTFITNGPVDQLDHAVSESSFGGKIGIDATAKLPEEGHARPWPQPLSMSADVEARILPILRQLGVK